MFAVCSSVTKVNIFGHVNLKLYSAKANHLEQNSHFCLT